ncbi:MOSC domain-containing protein [Salipaludibacillus sp. CF4.18]|uniref:MOSC domain-containing protein n=1 Tax=Salipaludibacillus sp. CF4.18 TaxID=3373081 RepID=UPI003EE80545
MKRLTANIISINVGKKQTLEGFGESVSSAIKKEPVYDQIFLSENNLVGDEQADLVNHGGLDKAVCVYPYDHYVSWEEELSMNLLPGAFGENITIKGLVENDVNIGDIFQWGEAQVQVSQPRKPCHKLAKQLNVPSMPKRVIERGYTGFYLRVLKEGHVSRETPLQFITRSTEVSIAYINQLYYQKKADNELIKSAAAVPELATSWKEMLLKKVK